MVEVVVDSGVMLGSHGLATATSWLPQSYPLTVGVIWTSFSSVCSHLSSRCHGSYSGQESVLGEKERYSRRKRAQEREREAWGEGETGKVRQKYGRTTLPEDSLEKSGGKKEGGK